jgi:hypothetical protein
MQRLDFEGRLSRRDQIHESDIQEHTLSWVWSTSPQPTSFTQWLRHGVGLFWICGKPGSGKSTLIDYLVEHERTGYFLNETPLSLNGSWTLVSFFFDFRSGTKLRNNFEGLLRSLLLQIIQKLPESFSHKPTTAKDQSQGKVQVDPKLDLNERRLRELLFTILETIDGKICIFIDGLDEYEGSVSQLIQLFRGIQRLEKVKLCIASRPTPMFLEAFESVPCIRMQDHNEDGIISYVFQTIDDVLPAAKRDARMMKLCTSISKRAEGVFLWARFAMEELIDGFCRGDQDSELLARLEDIPQDLEQIYARIIGRLKPQERREGIFALLIAGFAERPMALQEFSVALDLAMGSCKELPKASDDSQTELFSKRVRARTGGLLDLIKEERNQRMKEDSIQPTKESVSDGFHSSTVPPPLPPPLPLSSPSLFRRASNIPAPPPRKVSTSDRKKVPRPLPVLNRSVTSQPQRRQSFIEGAANRPKSLHVVKLIHRTVRTFLEREHWLDSLEANLNPHAILLVICVQYLQTILPTIERRSLLQEWDSRKMIVWEIEGKPYMEQWPASAQSYPFFCYAATHIFDHAISLEADGISSYPYLRSLPAEKFLNVHSYISNCSATSCSFCMEQLLSPFSLWSLRFSIISDQAIGTSDQPIGGRIRVGGPIAWSYWLTGGTTAPV